MNANTTSTSPAGTDQAGADTAALSTDKPWFCLTSEGQIIHLGSFQDFDDADSAVESRAGKPGAIWVFDVSDASVYVQAIQAHLPPTAKPDSELCANFYIDYIGKLRYVGEFKRIKETEEDRAWAEALPAPLWIFSEDDARQWVEAIQPHLPRSAAPEVSSSEAQGTAPEAVKQAATKLTTRKVAAMSAGNFLYQTFGRACIQFESGVFTNMSNLCESYAGGSWNTIKVSNGAVFMLLDTKAPTQMIRSPGNGYEGEMSTEAASVVASIFSLSQAIGFTGSVKLLQQLELLKDYAAKHEDGREIFRAID